MHETEEMIDLVSSFMFTPGKCKENQLITINQFSKLTNRWKSSEFYPKKYQNLHNCELLVWRQEFLYLQENLMRSLAEMHHFTIRRTEKRKIDDKRDLMEYFVTYSPHPVTFPLTATVPFHFDKMLLAVPPGEPYTPIEKMFLMFDDELWIAIVLTFAIFLAAIQVINRTSMTVRNFVYGRNIRTPSLNLAEVFLCGAQRLVPMRNFARFIPLLFVIWSMIIRTCYHSMMYSYLQDDMRRPAVQTSKELISRNFSYYDDGDPYYNISEITSRQVS